ncbi:MAG: hypothetical protein OXE47_01485 [Gammaproteobacteria bacterium]|nr:hypothetical protein [Gammaproteobacteria bacterium]
MKHIPYFDKFLAEQANLNKSRIETLEGRLASTTEFLKGNLKGYKKKENQGSYALGTIIKPVGNNGEFDADVLIYMKWEQDWEAKDYIDNTYRVFKENRNYESIVGRKTRCVCLDYAGEFHLDMVPCIQRNGVVQICNKKENAFEQSDGTGYRDWLSGKHALTNGNLKKVTRLLKYLRDYKGTFSIKSVLLTTLIGEHVYKNDVDMLTDLPASLKVISNRLNEFLQGHPNMPIIRNPVLPGEDFNRHWNQSNYDNFRNLFNSYNSKIDGAYAEKDHNPSVKKWRAIFGDKFGDLQENGGTPGGGSRFHDPVAPWLE